MTPPATLQALLTGAIDYAGLFPPARVSMAEAVARYASYLADRHAWALGRFVVPAARLEEFVTARQASSQGQKRSWELSATLGEDLYGDCRLVSRLNTEESGSTCATSVEMKVTPDPASARHQMNAVRHALPTSVHVFAELPLGNEIRDLVRAARGEGVFGKVRTGGVTADAFPSASDLAGFLLACAEERLPFKATAGLHHPCRGRYPLTYDVESPQGTMFGFLNVFVAATAAYTGVARREIVAILEEEQGTEFHFSDDALHWRNVRVSRNQLLDARNKFVLSFGSCSFEEPIQDLSGLSLL